MGFKTYKALLLEKLYHCSHSDRWDLYVCMEDKIRSGVHTLVCSTSVSLEKKAIMLDEYQDYYVKLYYPTRGELKERFYASQLVRTIMAEIRKECL